MEAFILSAVEQGVMTITLNRPDRLNSFNDLMHHQLAECLKQAERDDGVRCLLITGAGRGFCAGQDLNDRNVDPSGPPPDLGMSVERFYNPLVRRLAALPKPVICAVNGVAAGAGATLALGCDIVLAARSAKFVMAFSKLGLVPDCGGDFTRLGDGNKDCSCCLLPHDPDRYDQVVRTLEKKVFKPFDKK